MAIMKTIADEIRSFIEATGVRQADLARTSGVPASTICDLANGKRKNVIGTNQDKLRAAMTILLASTPTTGPGHSARGASPA